jgi:hypothetical protein
MLAEQAKSNGGRLYYESQPALVPLVRERVEALAMRLSHQLVDCAHSEAILYHSQSLFRGTQAKIHFRQESGALIFLLLFELRGPHQDQLVLLDDSWIIHPEQWRAAPLRGLAYRCFHLEADKLHRVTLSSSPPPYEQHQSDDFATTPAELMDVEPPQPTRAVPLAVCGEALAQLVGGDGGSAARYCQLLLDHSLRRKFGEQDPLAEYALFLANSPDYSHAQSLIGVLYGAVQHHAGQPFALHRLLEEVVALESALLRTAAPDADQMTVYGFIYGALPRAPVWLTAYRLPTESSAHCYWQHRDALYDVHAAWVCQMDLPALAVLRDGLLVLSERDFTQHFVPAFYGQLLTDLFNYMVRLRLEPAHFSDELQTLDRLHTMLHRATLDCYREQDASSVRARIDDFYRTLPLAGSLSAAYDWSVEYGCASTQTVEQMVVRLGRGFGGGGMRSLAFDRAALPDIEALVDGDYLPPCLAAVLARDAGHLKNFDRLDGTAYLAEMQYERDEVVAYLGRANDPRDIGVNYLTYQRRAQKKTATRYSPYCDSVIGRAPGQLLACPYRARTAGASPDDQKKDCRAQCASACSASYRGTLMHPLDFVSERLNSAAQNK